MLLIDPYEYIPREEGPFKVDRAAISPTSRTLIDGQERFDIANLAVFGNTFLMTGNRICRKPLARFNALYSPFRVLRQGNSVDHRYGLQFRCLGVAAIRT